MPNQCRERHDQSRPNYSHETGPIDSLGKTALIAGVIYLITKDSLTVGGRLTGTVVGRPAAVVGHSMWSACRCRNLCCGNAG